MIQDNKVDVVFATPSYDHKHAMEYTRSIIETNWLLWQAGCATGHMQRGGDCFVSKVRNKMATDFLNQFPDTENFFFIDDDIGWPAHKVLEFLNRPEDIVCGIYPKKSEELDFPVEMAFTPAGTLVENNGLYEAWIVPTGFMRIKRHVLEAVGKESGFMKDMDLVDGVGVIKEYLNIFECGPAKTDGNLFWGEDYTFCKKWRAMGGTIWVDPNIEFTHRGNKKWKNNMFDHFEILRRNAASRKITQNEAVAAE